MTETPQVDAIVEVFIAVRDKLKAMDDAHELLRKEWVEKKEKLSGWLLNFLDTNGLDNAKTVHGTVHTTTRSSASLADADLFMRFVIDNNEYDLLDRRANATAVSYTHLDNPRSKSEGQAQQAVG